MKFLVISILAVLLLSAISPDNDLYAQDKAAVIDKLLSLYHEYGQLNGSVLVSESGKIIFKKGYGLANMEWNIVNTPDTKFRIGSITKQFTAMIIMQLAEEGKIYLNENLTRYLQDYRKDTGDRVTIYHLLTHTSGIPSYTHLHGFLSDSARIPYDTDYMIRHFHSGDLEFEPGSRYAYNNTGYFLLAVIIQRITGKSFEENLAERIIEPLNMQDSGTDRNEKILDHRASGYIKHLTGFENEPFFYMKNALGTGDMYSTVGDLYRWDRALTSGVLLSEKYQAIMFTPYLHDYGFGWEIRDIILSGQVDTLRTVSHAGWLNGFHCLITRIPREKSLIVLLNNTGGTSLNWMTRGIINILNNQPYDPPLKSIAEELFKSIRTRDVSAAVDRYFELKRDFTGLYNFEEDELAWLGDELLRLDKLDEAIEIFRLNAEVYPQSPRVYDHLGSVYLKKGRKDSSLMWYRKSLQLDPSNREVKNMVKILEKTQ